MNYKKGTCKRQGRLQSSVKRWVLNTSLLFSKNQEGCLRKSFCCASLNSEMIVTSINDDRHRNAHMFLNSDFHTTLAYLCEVSAKMTFFNTSMKRDDYNFILYTFHATILYSQRIKTNLLHNITFVCS